MEKESNVVLGTIFLYTFVTSIFSLLSRVSVVFLTNSILKGLYIFGLRSSLWLFTVLIIIFVLYKLNKNQHQSFKDMLQNKTIRTTTSILVIIEVMINLSGFLPISIQSVHSAITITNQKGIDANGILANNIISSLFSLLIYIIQILFSIYLLKYYKNPKEKI